MALDQLLDNARRHTPPGTPVEVAAGTLDGRVTLTVEDHGPGVPDEMMPHLFDRFYRGDAARGRHAGFGLGLAVAAAIVDLHRGRIAAERGTAGGLRIRIELPA
jgi:signal transduction histidine kinase